MYPGCHTLYDMQIDLRRHEDRRCVVGKDASKDGRLLRCRGAHWLKGERLSLPAFTRCNGNIDISAAFALCTTLFHPSLEARLCRLVSTCVHPLRPSFMPITCVQHLCPSKHVSRKRIRQQKTTAHNHDINFGDSLECPVWQWSHGRRIRHPRVIFLCLSSQPLTPCKFRLLSPFHLAHLPVYRTVKDATQQPPWCLPLLVLGHTFIGEQFLAKASFSTQHTGQRLSFPACHVGDSVYQTLRLESMKLGSVHKPIRHTNI